MPGAADNVAAPLFVAVTRVVQDLAASKAFVPGRVPECDVEIDKVYRQGLADA
ncbi:hypothetical protein HK405_010629, partial [Cladochytrium tenue]